MYRVEYMVYGIVGYACIHVCVYQYLLHCTVCIGKIQRYLSPQSHFSLLIPLGNMRSPLPVVGHSSVLPVWYSSSLSIYLSIYPSIDLSIYLSIYLPIYRSIDQSYRSYLSYLSNLYKSSNLSNLSNLSN